MSDSVWPHRQQPTRLPRPWDSPGKNTGVGCHFLLQYMKVRSESEVTQSCPTLSDPMDCSLPGSSVHGIFQARVLEWGAIAFSDDQPRQHIKKQRHEFANKGLSSQSYGFSSGHVWMYKLGIKKGEHWRIDAFELWCWRRLLQVPWTVGRSNQSILKEISPEYSLEGLMLKLKPQYFGHLVQRTDSLEKTVMLEILKAGGKGDGRGWDDWMVSPTHWTWVWTSSGSWWWTGRPGVLQSMGSQRVGHNWLNWTGPHRVLLCLLIIAQDSLCLRIVVRQEVLHSNRLVMD